jgi:hypothetical protein
LQQGRQYATFEQVVAALCAVSCNVTKRPNGLVTHVVTGRLEEQDEGLDSASLNHILCLIRGTTGNVCESPSGLRRNEFRKGEYGVTPNNNTYLKLNLCIVVGEQLNESTHSANLDDFINWWVLLCTSVKKLNYKCNYCGSYQLIKVYGSCELLRRCDLQCWSSVQQCKRTSLPPEATLTMCKSTISNNTFKDNSGTTASS